MHDLNTINRLNREAFEACVGNLAGQGRWVITGYEGLHLVSVESFTNADEARSVYQKKLANQKLGEHFGLIPPAEPKASAGFAQTADAGTKASTPTPGSLGEYIALKSGNTTHGY